MEEEKQTSLLNNGLLWFGAAVSIAEILTGTLFAPLGMTNGILAILLGHVIGCTLLFLAGLIGAKRRMSAMETVRISFGGKGSYLFSALNVLQLVGWTAVMIIGGAKAMGVIVDPAAPEQNLWLWCALIGILILIWILVGVKNLGPINIFAVGGLFVLTIVLSAAVFKGQAAPGEGSMSFGSAVELSAAMPLSWLPLISDYTRQAKKPTAATIVSTGTYFIGSMWMYAIGLGAALIAGNSDIAKIMLAAGFGVVGVLIVVLSTVTTTFLDAYSAGVSFTNITKKWNEKWTAAAVCVIGTLIAIFTPIEKFQDFLYLIGSAFAPMAAVLIADYYILKKDHTETAFGVSNIILWIVGFILYRLFLNINTVFGSTLPVMVITGILCILTEKGKKLCLKKS